MNLKDALFKQPEANIYRIDEGAFELEDHSDWPLTPLFGETLCEDFSEVEGVLDGYFIVKAIWLKKDGGVERCYINVVVPERITDEAYLWIDGKIVCK